MNRIILTLLSALFVLNINAQQSNYFDAVVWDSSGTTLSNYKVWIQIFNNGTADVTKSGYTTSGVYRDSLPTSVAFDSVRFIAYDCNGDRIAGSWGTQNYQPGFWIYSDTLVPTCNLKDPSVEPGFVYKQSHTTPLTIDFKDNSEPSGVKNVERAVNMYFFGDGDSTFFMNDVSHTYAQSGTYYIGRFITERDTVNDIYVSSKNNVDTIVVSATTPTPWCGANYAVDTANSGNNIAIVYNVSQPSHNDSGYSIAYHWDFGDDDSANTPFPTHNYDTAGVYAVCLTIDVTDSLGFTCSSTFCDTLGIDTAGNLIYKNAGFTLQVLDPATIGAPEQVLTNGLELYPNPVHDYLNIRLPEGQGKTFKLVITDLKGVKLIERSMKKVGSEVVQFDLSDLPRGAYILKLSSGNNLYNQKILKR